MKTKTAVELELFRNARSIGEAHNGGLIRLPPPIVKAAARATELVVAARAASAARTTARDALRAMPATIVTRLVAEGPYERPGAPVIAARNELAEIEVSRGLIAGAADRALAAVGVALVEGALDIGSQLLAALRGVLDKARPDAPLLADVDWANPTAIFDQPADVQAGFLRLLKLSEEHDAIRHAAVAMHDELIGTRQDGADWRRRELVGQYPIADFIGAGVRGPASAVRGSPDYQAGVWTWSPTGHPVQRIVAAALAPPPVEPGIEPEIEPADDAAKDDAVEVAV